MKIIFPINIILIEKCFNLIKVAGLRVVFSGVARILSDLRKANGNIYRGKPFCNELAFFYFKAGWMKG